MFVDAFIAVSCNVQTVLVGNLGRIAVAIKDPSWAPALGRCLLVCKSGCIPCVRFLCFEFEKSFLAGSEGVDVWLDASSSIIIYYTLCGRQRFVISGINLKGP